MKNFDITLSVAQIQRIVEALNTLDDQTNPPSDEGLRLGELTELCSMFEDLLLIKEEDQQDGIYDFTA